MPKKKARKKERNVRLTVKREDVLPEKGNYDEKNNNNNSKISNTRFFSIG